MEFKLKDIAMKAIVKIVSNKPCSMIVDLTKTKELKNNQIFCFDIDLKKHYKMEFALPEEDDTNKRLSLELIPVSTCLTYVVYVDWYKKSVSCCQDNSNLTYRHLKIDENNKPYCFVYDAKDFSLCHGLDMPYEFVEDFNSKGLARVKYNNLFGVIDKQCRVVIPLEYNEIYILDQSFIVGGIGLKFSTTTTRVFSLDGKLIFERENVLPAKPSMELNNLIPITKYNGYIDLYGYINFDNEIVIPPIYKNIKQFHDNEKLFVVTLGERANEYHTGVIDIYGNIHIPFNYIDIHPIKQPINGNYIYVINRAFNRDYEVLDSLEQKLIDDVFEKVVYRKNLMCLLRNEEWLFYDHNLSLIMKYDKQGVNLYCNLIQEKNNWLPLSVVIDYWQQTK